eukprot:2917719-Pyramimonas_sp.AAC.1
MGQEPAIASMGRAERCAGPGGWGGPLPAPIVSTPCTRARFKRLNLSATAGPDRVFLTIQASVVMGGKGMGRAA